MSFDLQTAIREALHADDITTADLRQPVLRARHRRPARQAIAIAAVVAAVVVLAVALSVATSNRPKNNTVSGNGPLAGVVGYRWRVVRLTDPFGRLPVPASLHAQIDFTRDGYVLGNDTVNGLQANYRSTGEAYTVHNAGTTLVGSAGLPPRRKRTMAAVDAMFFSFASEPGATTPPAEVAVRLHGDTLTLHRARFTLILHRAGPQPDFFAQSPRPTQAKTS